MDRLAEGFRGDALARAAMPGRSAASRSFLELGANFAGRPHRGVLAEDLERTRVILRGDDEGLLAHDDPFFLYRLDVARRVEAKHYNAHRRHGGLCRSPHWAKSFRPSKPAQSPASKTEPDAARHQGRAVVGGRRSGLTLSPCQGLG